MSDWNKPEYYRDVFSSEVATSLGLSYEKDDLGGTCRFIGAWCEKLFLDSDYELPGDEYRTDAIHIELRGKLEGVHLRFERVGPDCGFEHLHQFNVAAELGNRELPLATVEVVRDDHDRASHSVDNHLAVWPDDAEEGGNLAGLAEFIKDAVLNGRVVDSPAS